MGYSVESGIIPQMVVFAKWIGLCIVLALSLGFVVSVGRSISWFDQTISYTIALQCGGVAVGWRPADYNADADRFRAKPGFVDAVFAGDGICLEWLPARSRSTSWVGMTLPLWMGLVPAAMPTGWLWWRDRRRTISAFRKLALWTCPKRQVRLTIRSALIWTVGYGLFVGLLGEMLAQTLDYLLPYSTSGQDAAFFAIRVLFLATPVAGPLCAWASVRVRNHLFNHFSDGKLCMQCGYNLSGNVSGRCPECGRAIAVSQPS